MPLFKRKQEKQKPVTPPTTLKGSATVKRTPSTRSNPQTPDSLNGDMGLPSSLLGPREPGSPPQLVLSEEVLESLQEPGESDSTSKSPMKTSSRLSKTLQEILHDKDALQCFIEFMESQQADHFIRFWLDANSFRAATLTRIHSHSLKSVGSSSILKRRSGEKGGAVSGSIVTDEKTSHTHSEGQEEICFQDVPQDVEAMGTERNKQRTEDSKSRCDNQPRSAANSHVAGCDSDESPKQHESALSRSDLSASGSQVSASVVDDRIKRNHLYPSENLSPVSGQTSLPHLSTDSVTSVSRHVHHEHSGRWYNSQESGGHTFPAECDRLQPDSTEECVISDSTHREATCDTESIDTLTEERCPDSSLRNEDRSCPAAEGYASSSQCVGEGTGQTVSVVVSVDGANGGQTVLAELSGGQPLQGVTDEDATTRQHRTVSAEDMKERLKKSIERDAVSIFTKYIAQDAPHPIGVDDELRGETIRKICREDGQVDPDCFVACQDFVVHHMEKEYHKPFSDSEFHYKHQVHVLTNGKVYLADVLYNEHALCYFMEFMEQEGASHLMQFWMAADNFQQQLIQQQGNYDGMQAQSDAMILYDKFFSLQATMPLGFDDKIRFEVEGNICREGGPLPDCFSKPHDVVLQIMDKVYFPRYLGGDIYYRYLSDLVSTVQMSQDLPVRKHQRQASDASSEHSAGSQSLGAESISFRNTLLASGSRTARKSTSSGSLSGSVGKIEEQLGTMDSDFLNPDKLWTQPRKGPLSFGRVNALGQFLSEFDPDPESEKKKGGGFFKKKKEKDKEQEEMAMQVAQMILSDVAAMTQIGDVCSRSDDESTSGISTTSKSLSAPASATSFFDPPPS